MEKLSRVFGALLSRSVLYSISIVIAIFAVALFFSAINQTHQAAQSIIIIDLLLIAFIFVLLSTEYDNGIHCSVAIGAKQVSVAIVSLMLLTQLQHLYTQYTGQTVSELVSFIVLVALMVLTNRIAEKQTQYRLIKWVNYTLFFGLFMVLALFVFVAYAGIGSDALQREVFEVVRNFHELIMELL